jgi:hypothetical protein
LVTSANACSQSGHPHFILRRRPIVKRLFMHNPLIERGAPPAHRHHFSPSPPRPCGKERAEVRSQCLRAPRPNPPRLAGRGSYFSSARVSRCARLDGAWGFIASGSTNIPRLTALKFAFRENIPPLGT